MALELCESTAIDVFDGAATGLRWLWNRPVAVDDVAMQRAASDYGWLWNASLDAHEQVPLCAATDYGWLWNHPVLLAHSA
jgi:hypothetical protein